MLQKITIFAISTLLTSQILAGTYPYSFVDKPNDADDYLKSFMQQMNIIQINNYATRQGFIHYKNGDIQAIGCELPLNAKVTLDKNKYAYHSFSYGEAQDNFNAGLKGYLIKCVVNSV